MENGRSYHVGQDYDHWKTNQTYIQMNYNGTWGMVIGFPNITKQEVEEIQNGDFQIAHVMIDDVLFFLCKCGNMEWIDMPYEPRLYECPMEYPEFENGTDGAILTLYIVDTCSGKLVGLRLIGLGNVFSNNLHASCREMDRVRLRTPEQYSKQVEEIYRKYPKSADMLKWVKPENIFLLFSKSSPI